MSTPISQQKEVVHGSVNGKGEHAKAWISAILLALVAALVLGLYDRHMVSGLIRADAMDYAQIGRNLINGNGLSTYILRPLALTHGPNAMVQPDVTHGPFYPFLIALAFGLFQAKDGVVQALSGLCFVLTVPLLIVLGQRLFNRTVGILGAAVFMFNPAMLQWASEGSVIPLVVLLATCLFLALDRVALKAHARGAEPTIRPAKAALVLTGLLAGLLYLTEPLFFWLLPILIVTIVLWHPQRRGLVAAWMLLPMCLLVLPCMVRFGMLTGNPAFGLRGSEIWMSTRAYPGFTGYRMTSDYVTPGADLVKSVLLKIFLAWNTGISALQHMPATCILIFVAPGLFFRYGDRGVNKVRSIALACLLGVFIGSTLFIFDPNVLMVAFPILLLYALAYLMHLTQEAKLNSVSKALVNTGFAVLLLFPLAASLVTTRSPETVPQAAVAYELQKQSHQDDISFSDKPWIVAWYANRPSIWIPVQDDKVTALRKQFPKARWLFLTPETRSLSQEWDIAFNGLNQWNRQYQQNRQDIGSLPTPLLITKQQLPLTEALDGFQSVPPVETETLSAVLAVVPEAAPSNLTAGKPIHTPAK
jgi:4-amino-4-deoxy-L-arabinose transferase-like glycosyltransferase